MLCIIQAYIITNAKYNFIEKKKKSDLKILRQEKWQGCYIRSKIQWAEEGEKPF
jgi:hypothetical protein